MMRMETPFREFLVNKQLKVIKTNTRDKIMTIIL